MLFSQQLPMGVVVAIASGANAIRTPASLSTLLERTVQIAPPVPATTLGVFAAKYSNETLFQVVKSAVCICFLHLILSAWRTDGADRSNAGTTAKTGGLVARHRAIGG